MFHATKYIKKFEESLYVNLSNTVLSNIVVLYN